MQINLLKKYYTIQEVASEMKLRAHTLRYYEKIGLLHPIQREEHGRRVYTEQDLGWIYWLKLLRESGMPIKMMKRYVDLTREGECTIDERCAILEEHRNQLRGMIAQLNIFLDKLDQKVEFYRGYEKRPGKTAS